MSDYYYLARLIQYPDTDQRIVSGDKQRLHVLVHLVNDLEPIDDDLGWLWLGRGDLPGLAPGIPTLGNLRENPADIPLSGVHHVVSAKTALALALEK